MKSFGTTLDLKSKARQELQDILEWWMENMVDHENGGFFGRMDGNGQLHPLANKGVILNTRILWTFAAAARLEGKQEYRRMADRAFQYLIQYFWDVANGGVNWMLDYQGNLVAGKKQIYAQAFAVYALAEYFQLTRQQAVLEKAVELFGLIEYYSRDKEKGGYIEAFSPTWSPLNDFRLSNKDANEAKTMNTHLHILEAYTNLYRVHQAAPLRMALKGLTELFLDRFIDKDTKHLHLFFNENWDLKSSEISYGHDIEAAWLLVEAAELLGEKALLRQCEELAVAIATVTIREGVDKDGGLFNEGKGQEVIDSDKHWWPQAEAVVGFYNAYQISQQEKFLLQARKTWQFIDRFLKDKTDGEWNWMVDQLGKPILDKEDKAGPWKAPYHNGRMCMELLRRIK